MLLRLLNYWWVFTYFLLRIYVDVVGVEQITGTSISSSSTGSGHLNEMVKTPSCSLAVTSSRYKEPITQREEQVKITLRKLTERMGGEKGVGEDEERMKG